MTGVKLAVQGTPSEDVSGVLYEITCEDGTTIEEYVPLEDQGLPPHVDGNLAGEPFADFFTVLAPGDCTVTATAMTDPNTPSEHCAPVSQDVTIVAGETTEILLEIQCQVDPSGALDVITVITDGPSIIDIDYDDSKFITQCEEVTVDVTAEGDGELTYDFEVTGAPANAVYDLTPDGSSFTFHAETPGEYTIVVTVDDGDQQTTMEIPIHVGTDPDVEHCDEVCCQLEDGHVFFGGEGACEEAGGAAVSEERCHARICCRTPEGLQVVQAGDCPQGAALPLDRCQAPQVCCKMEDGSVVDGLSGDECEASGGATVADETCEQDVCCKLETPTVIPIVDCPGGQLLSMDACAPEKVCCRLDDGSVVEVSSDECDDAGGTDAGADHCAEVCCQVGDEAPMTMYAADCDNAAGVAVDPDLCDDAGNSQVWQADYTLDTEVECESSPYLVVPSSGANQLAVYDLQTLTHLPTSPFDTCANPSRILMDANTDVVATCRAGGKVYKHTRDGALLWATQLPMCNASRGVALSGDGRLFAGCSDHPGRVFELDPATGAILDNVVTNARVYGLAVAPDGVYVSHYFDQKVSKITLGGPTDLTMSWQVQQQAYGISVDPTGDVWVGGGQMTALARLDGSVVETVNSGWVGGVQVGLNGKVYGAGSTTHKVVEYDPLTQTVTDHPLGGTASYSHGITVDADDNAYTINKTSQTLTKVEPNGTTTHFGGGILTHPYGYSGDMTGIHSACLAGTTDEWISSELDTGDPTTTWGTLTWTATTPPGSSVSVYYSTDGGATWTQATNGQNLGVIAQTFQVKAILQTTNPGNPPSIGSVTVTYQ